MVLRGGACHTEREQGWRVLDGSICSASETCVCVNQGDIKFERDRGAPIRLVVRQIAERGKVIFHPLDNAVHVNFLEVELWKL